MQRRSSVWHLHLRRAKVQRLPTYLRHRNSSAAAPSRSAPSVRGRGLSWNDDENTVLAMIAQSVCSDPARGNEMKTGKFQRLLRLKFCSTLMANLKSECHKFEEAMQLVKSSDITGNPDEAQLSRCATALYNSRVSGNGASTVTPHFTDICKNPYYRVGKPFPYARAHQHLSKYTDLITADAGSAYSLSTSESVGEEDITTTENADARSTVTQVARPIGTKLAKRLKKRKQGSDEDLNEHIGSMASAMHERNHLRKRGRTPLLLCAKRLLSCTMRKIRRRRRRLQSPLQKLLTEMVRQRGGRAFATDECYSVDNCAMAAWTGAVMPTSPSRSLCARGVSPLMKSSSTSVTTGTSAQRVEIDVGKS
eukprot:IDg3934t1